MPSPQENTPKHNTALYLCKWPEPAAKHDRAFPAPRQMEASAKLAKLEFCQKDSGGSLLNHRLCSQLKSRAKTGCCIHPRSNGVEKVEDLRGSVLRAAPDVPLRSSGP